MSVCMGPATPVTYGAGGSTGGPTGPTVDATSSTGDGGMGWLTNPDPRKGANGGSGIVIVRYQLTELCKRKSNWWCYQFL